MDEMTDMLGPETGAICKKPRFWAKINGSFLKNQKEDASGNNHVLDHSLFCAAQKSKPAFLVQKPTFHEGIQHV